MDGGNEVDLSNNNITPLWKRRTANGTGPRDSRKPKPRPLSYQIDGVTVTDFPVEDRCSFTLTQPAERLMATHVSGTTSVLKHILNKPAKKSRVVRSISIGYVSSERFPLSRFRTEDARSASLDNKVYNGAYEKGRTTNGVSTWHDRRLQDHQQKRTSLDSRRDQMALGTSSESAPPKQSSAVLSLLTSNNDYNHNHQYLHSDSSPPGSRTPTPSHSSTSSIPSLSSLNSSDPPTPRSPSPADRWSVGHRQSSSSLASSQDATRAASPCPSLTPSMSISPPPSVVLSTHSPAALKMGTQQLIPKGLALDSRRKPASAGQQQQGHGMVGLLGLDHSKRALKTLSMVETGAFFSTGESGVCGEGADGEGDSPGTLQRGLRSTSYRRAVVSGVDLEVPSVDPKAHRLSQPALKGLQEEGNKPTCPTSPGSAKPAGSGSVKPSSTSSAKLSSPGSAKPTSPGSAKPSTPSPAKPTCPGTVKASSPSSAKSSSPGKNKSPDKKKVLTSQRTFDSEEEELYQNYQEKALHNDSDEDADSREPKPDERIVVQYRPIRISWAQLSVVKERGLADKLSQEERKRQEAIFEVISSEHSYLHSLEILIRMFKDSVELSNTMTKTERHHLFSNITDVSEASKKFFNELEDRHTQNCEIDDISDIVYNDISDIVYKHASQANFDPYITYCSNEVYQQRTLQRLVSNKSAVFKEVLTKIEGHPDCKNLPMISFLILPMQRITRLPLLMDTICQKTPKDSPRYEECKKALQAISKVVRKCNEGARTMERTEMMYTINSQLEFKIKAFPLVSSSRWMVKRGELTALGEENGIFSKRVSRQQVYFFLFNDVLIITTRKKSEDSYTVIDYALRDQIWVGPSQPEDLCLSPIRTTASMLTSRQPGTNHLFRLGFRSNHSGGEVLMILGVELMNERARWISALGQSNNDKKNQDRTNAMQVEVTRTYTAKQPDELSLQVADVVLVSETVEDGWYEGERLRDGERGWFLSECAQPITCQATIQRNMQRMDRLQGVETNV